jgi:hypothetical protein
MKGGIIMKKKKYLFGILSTLLSVSMLFGCAGEDEEEPDPSEEPSEQHEDTSD